MNNDNGSKLLNLVRENNYQELKEFLQNSENRHNLGYDEAAQEAMQILIHDYISGRRPLIALMVYPQIVGNQIYIDREQTLEIIDMLTPSFADNREFMDYIIDRSTKFTNIYHDGNQYGQIILGHLDTFECGLIGDLDGSSFV